MCIVVDNKNVADDEQMDNTFKEGKQTLAQNNRVIRLLANHKRL